MNILGYWFTFLYITRGDGFLYLIRGDGFKIFAMYLIALSFLVELVKHKIKLDWTHFIRMGTALLIFIYWYKI